MYRELARLPIEGVVVVGEGEENETPLLYIGETVGAGGPSGHRVDLAVDPVEGSTLCAKALPNALSVMALAEGGSLLKVPPIYMEKIAIGPGFPEGLVDLDAVTGRQSEGARSRQGRARQRDRRLHPRPAAPRQAHRGGAGIGRRASD